MPAGRRLVQPAGESPQRAGEHQADRHGVPVPPAVLLHPLDGVRERVPVVEDLAHPGLAQVAGDHVGLHPDRPFDQLARHGPGRVGGRHRVRLDEVQDRRVGDEAALDDLGHPGGQLGRRQAVERGEVGEHPHGRVEGTHEVLAGGGVDAGLAAHRGVDHAEQRGGHRHPAHPAQPARGHEPGQVGDRAAAHADHRVGAGEAGRAEAVPAGGRHVDVLARLRVRHLHRQRGRAGGPQPFAERVRQLLQRRSVQQRHPGGAGQQAGQRVEQVASHQHVVRPLAADRDPGHLVHRRQPSPAGPVRAASSTWWVPAVSPSAGRRSRRRSPPACARRSPRSRWPPPRRGAGAGP